MNNLTDMTRAGIAGVLSGERRGWRSRLLFAGPAIIASVAYMDPGNYATNIQAGAGYGYTLLWVVLMANLIAMLFQALSARLGCRLALVPPRLRPLQRRVLLLAARAEQRGAVVVRRQARNNTAREGRE